MIQAYTLRDKKTNQWVSFNYDHKEMDFQFSDFPEIQTKQYWQGLIDNEFYFMYPDRDKPLSDLEIIPITYKVDV